ncbi:MAG: hypothetical protein JEY71_02195 [Sphaerochaeta sp.]|nr:hypothetical protein [Sphaerochaeta sp.]
MKELEEKKISRLGYQVECEVSVQAKTEEDEEPWDVEKAIELGKTFVIGYRASKKNFENYMPVLLKAQQELSKEGNPHRRINGDLITWNDYCETIGVSRRTANNWLANYRLAIGEASPKKKRKDKPSGGIQDPPEKPIKDIKITVGTKDEDGNLVINYHCSDCGLKHQITIIKEIL